MGRDDELATALRCLDRGRGVVLAGPSGVGKTRLAEELLGVAGERGHVTLRLGATEASAELPLGCFAALLPEITPGVERVAMFRQIVRAIVDRGGGRPVRCSSMTPIFSTTRRRW